MLIVSFKFGLQLPSPLRNTHVGVFKVGDIMLESGYTFRGVHLLSKLPHRLLSQFLGALRLKRNIRRAKLQATGNDAVLGLETTHEASEAFGKDVKEFG